MADDTDAGDESLDVAFAANEDVRDWLHDRAEAERGAL